MSFHVQGILKALVIVLLFQQLALAETVVLKSGRTLQGEITYQDENLIHLILSSGLQVVLEMDTIQTINGFPPGHPTATPEEIPLTAVTPVWTPEPVPEARMTPSPGFAPSIISGSMFQPTPTPRFRRNFKIHFIDKQEHRTLLARRYVYHIGVEEEITDWEARHFLIERMRYYRREEIWADAIEIRLYGRDSRGRRYEWPFAVATYAPEGEWEKAQADISRNEFLLRIRIHDQVEMIKL